MANYWQDVPKGTWTVTDTVDAFNALRDSDSVWHYDATANRINVFGPEDKALIIDLAALFKDLTVEEKFSLIAELEEFDIRVAAA